MWGLAHTYTPCTRFAFRPVGSTRVPLVALRTRGDAVRVRDGGAVRFLEVPWAPRRARATPGEILAGLVRLLEGEGPAPGRAGGLMADWGHAERDGVTASAARVQQ